MDPDKIGLGACFFVLVKTSEHYGDWQSGYIYALKDRTKVIEAQRLAGEIDCFLKVQVATPRTCNHFYQSLISEVKVVKVTALLSMQGLRYATALPP